MSMKDIMSKSKSMQRAKLKSYGAKGEDITDRGTFRYGGRVHKAVGGSLGEDLGIGSLGGEPPKTPLSRKPRGEAAATNITINFPPKTDAAAATPPPVPPMALTPPPALPPGPPPGPMAGLGAPPPGMMPPPPGPPLRANGGRISNLGKYAHGGKVQKAAGGGLGMTAGSCSGEGRLEKVELVKRHKN